MRCIRTSSLHFWRTFAIPSIALSIVSWRRRWVVGGIDIVGHVVQLLVRVPAALVRDLVTVTASAATLDVGTDGDPEADLENQDDDDDNDYDGCAGFTMEGFGVSIY